ncbi:MAG TPA: tRNA pseudouridine(55) synthase TruB [Limnochordales bacterium]
MGFTADQPGPEVPPAGRRRRHQGDGEGEGESGAARADSVSLCGVLNVLKPPGYTSHDVVARVRRLLGVRRIGHTGTLDPGAAGVLVLCVGRATRLVDLLQADDKAYRFELVLGVHTDSHDAFGAPVAVRRDMQVRRDALDAAVARFQGDIEQVPPMTSALKRHGRRLYELARQGLEVERPARRVRIYSLRVVRVVPDAAVLPFGTRVLLDVVCSKGTYVRTLCADLGQALGCGAYMSFLLRTRAGAFHLADARTLEELEGDLARGALPLIGMDEALGHLPAVRLSQEGARRVAHGQEAGPADLAEGTDAAWPPDGRLTGPVRLHAPDGRLVAVADRAATAKGLRLRPRIVLI